MVKVSTRKVFIPMPDLSRTEFTHTINLNSKTGEFTTQVPKHIGGTMRSFPNLTGGSTCSTYDDRQIIKTVETPYTLRSGTLREIKENFDRLCHDYVETIKSSRKRVLVITFRANIYTFEPPIDKSDPNGFANTDRCVIRLDQISFARYPCLELHYEVCYKVGTKYFDLHMRGVGDIDNLGSNTIMIDFTQERFEFFQNAERNIEKMITNINAFFEGIKEEPMLLDQFISKTKLLPQSKEE